jgi:lysophospholipid acyltransferase (LPLAT)-like uncharacterized protein
MTLVEEPSVSRKRKSGVVVPHSASRSQRFAAWLICLFGRSVASTLRYRWVDRSGLSSKPPVGQAIYCIWHNRLALSMAAYTKYIRPRNEGRGLAALVSASKDGGLLAGILECFGVQAVRGSTSRRGPQALLELTTWAERGYDLSITPDGPRGPCYVVQEGVMSLAQITGLPIIPFSYNARWKLRVKSWDRFQIPLPFSYCEMILGEPIHIPRETSDDEREALRKKVQSALMTISKD